MSKQATKKELTGWHVLGILVAFFGIMLAVNVYFTVMAVKTFSGEDVPRSYRQGLEYNHTLQIRAAQKALGWEALVNTIADKIIVDLRDKDGQVLHDISLTGKLRHPATLSNDQVLNFERQEDGTYQASIFGLMGQWKLEALATTEEGDFRFEYELWLQ